MKKIILALFLSLLPFQANAALSAATNWELRGNGNDTNGGGFTLGVSAIAANTDLVVDASIPTDVTSAARPFTSADIGRWIAVTAGTGWRVGYYQVTAVSGVIATLNVSPAATSTTGGTFSIYRGLDYSQQDAKNPNGGSNGSSVLASAAGTTALTCSDCNFTLDMVGNVVYLEGGTGSITAQRRAITAFTNSTTVTMDASIAASTGMTLNVGGALASLGEVFGTRGIIASNVIWWKNDVGLTSSTAVSTSIAGGQLKGYYTTRGDLDGSIGSANRPTFTFTGTAAYAMTFSSSLWHLRNFIINSSSGSGANGINTTSTLAFIFNVTAKNYDGIGILLAGSGECYACEVTGGTANATKGISVVNSGIVWDSYVHDGVGIGIGGSSTATILNNIVSNMSGVSSDGIQMSAPVNNPPIIMGNTVYNSGRHGIAMLGVSTSAHITGNVLVNNAGYGISLSANSYAFPAQDGNAFYNNTLGTKNNMTALSQGASNPAYAPINDIILSGNPFTNAGTGDFSLNNTAGAGADLRDSGLPRAWAGSATTGYPDMGAVTHQDTGTTTVIYPNYAY